MKHPSGGSTMVRAVSRFLLVLVIVALATPAPAQTPKRGGVIRIAEREAPGLDPHLSISFLTHSYVSLSYSQLVRFPNGPEQKSPTDFSILPDLAEKWTVSKDGKVYTRSEERRVGKECRSRGAPDPEKKKQNRTAHENRKNTKSYTEGIACRQDI